MSKRTFSEICSDPETKLTTKINIVSEEDYELITTVIGKYAKTTNPETDTTDIPETDIPETTKPTTQGTWVLSTSYKEGDIVTFDGVVYKCIQANDAVSPDWCPKSAASLWTAIGEATTPDNTTTEPPTTDTTTTIPTPKKLFAPYFDFCSDAESGLVEKIKTSKANAVTLAFINGDGWLNNLAWGGYYPLKDTSKLSDIKKAKSAGLFVIVSSGGANGSELAQTITDANKLAAAYETIFTTTNCDGLDIDCEGAAVADPTSFKRRHQALAIVQKKFPEKYYSYTLPVLQTGLTDGVSLLKDAQSKGVKLNCVNIMAM